MKKEFLFLIASLPVWLFAQDVPTEIVSGIDLKSGVQIVEQAARESGYLLAEFNPDQKIVTTDWIEWNSLGITNHARLQFTVDKEKVVIQMVDRQYKTAEGWSVVPTNLSKKNHEKFLGSIAAKISEIGGNPETTATAVYNSSLIKMFKPVIQEAGLEWRFINAQKSFDDPPHTIVHLSVSNQTGSSIDLVLGDFDFRDSGSKTQGTKNGYSAASFNEVVKSLGGRITKATLAAGQVKDVFLYSLMKSDFPDVIQDFNLSVVSGTNKIQLINHNMPIPFENKF